MADVRTTATVKVANVRTALLIIRVSTAATVRTVRSVVTETVSREHVRMVTARLTETQREANALLTLLVTTIIIREIVRSVLLTTAVSIRMKMANSVHIVRVSTMPSRVKAVIALSSVHISIMEGSKAVIIVRRVEVTVRVLPIIIRMRNTA